MSDLSDRLRGNTGSLPDLSVVADRLDELEAEIERLREAFQGVNRALPPLNKRIAALEAALKPFADQSGEADIQHQLAHGCVPHDYAEAMATFTIGDLRRAYKALEQGE